MIAYFFPPLGGAGVQRALKLARYLPEFGWSPVVLTSEPDPGAVLDPTLTGQIPQQALILRVKGLHAPRWLPWRLRSWITRWLLVVDEQLGWYLPAVSASRELVQQNRAQVLFSTSSPYTCHLIALALKRSTGLPWVADFRDPWLDNPGAAYPTRWHARWVAALEKKVCLSADRILVTTPRARQALLERLVELPPEKVVYLPNGYDPQDYDSLQPAEKMPLVFNIVHTGSFYSQGRTPNAFLSALHSLVSSGEIPRDQIRLHLAGSLGKPARQAVQQSGISDLVVEHGYLSHHESLQRLLSADLLLLVNHPGQAGELVVPAKFYEYLGAGKPVLILSSPGAVIDLASQLGAGTAVEPDDVDAITEAILENYRRWQRGDLQVKVRNEDLQPYQRRSQAGQLAEVLEYLVR